MNEPMSAERLFNLKEIYTRMGGYSKSMAVHDALALLAEIERLSAELAESEYQYELAIDKKTRFSAQVVEARAALARVTGDSMALTIAEALPCGWSPRQPNHPHDDECQYRAEDGHGCVGQARNVLGVIRAVVAGTPEAASVRA